MRLRIAGRQMRVMDQTLDALAEALGTDRASAAKWLRRGPEYYSKKAMPSLDPFKAFRRRVIDTEAAEAGWRIVDAETLQREARTNAWEPSSIQDS